MRGRGALSRQLAHDQRSAMVIFAVLCCLCSALASLSKCISKCKCISTARGRSAVQGGSLESQELGSRIGGGLL